MTVTAGSMYRQGEGTVYVSRVTNHKVFYHPVLSKGVCFRIEWSKTLPKFVKSVSATVFAEVSK